MGPYRESPHAPATKLVTKRTRWNRLRCWLGFHEGPFTIGLHVIECDACERIVSD